MVGNMIINYGMGVIAHSFGIDHLMTLAVMIAALMLILSIIILRKLKNSN
jgi:fucose permease